MTVKREAKLPEGIRCPASSEETIALLENLKPGEAVLYHRGQLASDRNGVTHDAIVTDRVANAAYLRARKNRAHLLQYPTNRPGVTAYVAVGQGRRYAIQREH